VALCYRNRAYTLMHLERHDDAVSACQQALYIYNQLGLEDLAATTHCELATAYFALSDFHSALSECELGLAFWDTLPGSADMVACQKWRGLALAELDRPAEAYAALSASWDMLEEAGQIDELAELLPAVERVLDALGRGKEAESYRDRLRAARSASSAAGTPGDY
jgi:tetratricopeptide (TPR) repeat protein